MKKNLLLIVFVFTCLANRVNAQWTQSLDTVGTYLASGGTNLFAGRSSNGVFLSTDTGNNWTAVNNGLGANPQVKALGTNGAIVYTMVDSTPSIHVVYVSTNAGTTWVADSNGLGNATVLTFAFKDTNIFAGTNGAGIFLTSTNGTNWTAVNNGLTNLIVRAIVFNDTNIFAGTKNNGVFLSTDNGANWTAVNNGLTILGITALATSGNNIYVGTSGGGVSISSDNGGSWTAVNTGLSSLSIKALATFGTNVFVAADGGGVFLSTDSGANWTDESAGLPSLLPTALAINQNYLFVGLDVNGAWRIPLADFGLCLPTSSTLTPATCDTYTSPSGNYTWAVSGTYSDTLLNAAGCDSVITINLTVNTVNVSVTQILFTLTSSATPATYQWLNCNTGFSAIGGATNQSYTATANGNYAVRVTQNGCVDTSACVNITGVGISENTFGGNIAINPNPTTGNFSLNLGDRYTNLKIEITDITGRLVYSEVYEEAKLVNLQLNEPSGVYFISVSTDNRKATFRLIKD